MPLDSGSSDLGRGRMEGFGSWVLDAAAGVSRMGSAGAVAGWGGGVAGFLEPCPARVRAVLRRGAEEGFGRVDPDVFRAAWGGVTSRSGEVFAGRIEGVGFFPVAVRGLLVTCAAA
jgi:hypothetical protein